MGGSAFKDPYDDAKSLHTPRMPPHIYRYARDRALSILSAFYAHAQCPIEAPAKIGYGDVDVLVACPRDGANTDTVSLMAALGATQYVRNGPVTNFALPWPTGEELGEGLGHDAIAAADTAPHPGLGIVGSPSPSIVIPNPSLDAHHHGTFDYSGTTTDSPQRYIQLDLHTCPTPERFHWELFHQAHGDLWNILGGMIRPYGLVVNHVGLHLRLADVHDNVSRDQRVVQLFTSPSAVLKFLDLADDDDDDGGGGGGRSYWTPFESLDAMFAYAASCRFFDPKASRGKEDLKANDRLRMKKRPAFAKWYEGYLVEHREDEPGRSAGVEREEVVEEAKRVFGVGREYDEKRARGLRKMGEKKLWSDIRKGLPVEGLRVGVVMRGVKREVVVGQTTAVEGEEGKGEETDQHIGGMHRAYIEGRFDEIAAWVAADWEGIEQRQNAHERAQSTKHLLAKLERDRDKLEVRTVVAVDSDSTKSESGGGIRGAELSEPTSKSTSTFETGKMLGALGR